jgi:hypothetical protein
MTDPSFIGPGLIQNYRRNKNTNIEQDILIDCCLTSSEHIQAISMNSKIQ